MQHSCKVSCVGMSQIILATQICLRVLDPLLPTTSPIIEELKSYYVLIVVTCLQLPSVVSLFLVSMPVGDPTFTYSGSWPLPVTFWAPADWCGLHGGWHPGGAAALAAATALPRPGGMKMDEA